MSRLVEKKVVTVKRWLGDTRIAGIKKKIGRGKI